ncbi:hypothetical protein [Fructobacillus papyrifericola]|uniref:Uncharacterized protein n=1 Tax=Fructobacillus papyrifericola TaxID=2713172 RepID=A0ABS5QT68_9LACO|nr:hypothetical protein [Fructobacillus papyrifericola]MBS9335690.1 hypothetical protein [Fructobacillus papyrifericola]
MNLHDEIKKNYENGLYNRDYSYHSSFSNEAKNETSDFVLGQKRFEEDKQRGRVHHWFSRPILKFMNRLTKGRLTEILDFIDGYQSKK